MCVYMYQVIFSYTSACTFVGYVWVVHVHVHVWLVHVHATYPASIGGLCMYHYLFMCTHVLDMYLSVHVCLDSTCVQVYMFVCTLCLYEHVCVCTYMYVHLYIK